jgi:hypothetical protein
MAMSKKKVGSVRRALVLVCLGIVALSGVLVYGKAERTTGSERETAPSLEHTAAHLEAGDLLFRRGRSLHSHAVLLSDPASRFSHVGLVVEGEEELLVAHSVPAEGETAGGVRLEPLERFLAPDAAVDWAALRLVEGAERGRVAARWAKGVRGVEFDAAFDLGDPRSLYCTELVWRAYLEAGVDLVENRFDEVSFPLFQSQRVLLPSRLLGSRFLAPVFLGPTSGDLPH